MDLEIARLRPLPLPTLLLPRKHWSQNHFQNCPYNHLKKFIFPETPPKIRKITHVLGIFRSLTIKHYFYLKQYEICLDTFLFLQEAMKEMFGESFKDVLKTQNMQNEALQYINEDETINSRKKWKFLIKNMEKKEYVVCIDYTF